MVHWIWTIKFKFKDFSVTGSLSNFHCICSLTGNKSNSKNQKFYRTWSSSVDAESYFSKVLGCGVNRLFAVKIDGDNSEITAFKEWEDWI
jgi:hypothetical protein